MSEKKQDLRIKNHPVLEFNRGKEVSFKFHGRRLKGYENESIAAALFASGIRKFSESLQYRHPRGWFCGIGKCSSCLMRVNGVPNVRTCITPVREGMKVERQQGKGRLPSRQKSNVQYKKKDVQTLIVGGGPAGLAAGMTTQQLGVETLIVDEQPRMGGQLIKQTHKFFGSEEQHAGVRGINIAGKMLQELEEYDGEYYTGTSVVGYYGNGKNHKFLAVKRNGTEYTRLEIQAEDVVVAPGAQENYLGFPGNYLPGVYGAGGVQTLMNTYGVKPGHKALIIGAGNVGLILAYQLLQADVEVKAVVEALPQIGGYLVHASKISRLGVPILTKHSIKHAKGKEHVKGATIVKLDENWQEVEGTEQELDVDLICIAIGLSPSNQLLSQAGCQTTYSNRLGGWVALHNRNLKTTLPRFYVAGDASGIEEASTAMMEGKLAGADIAESEGCSPSKAKEIKQRSHKHLQNARESPFLKPVTKGKGKIWKKWKEAM